MWICFTIAFLSMGVKEGEGEERKKGGGKLERTGGSREMEEGQRERESKERNILVKGAILYLARNLTLGKFPGIPQAWPQLRT